MRTSHNGASLAVTCFDDQEPTLTEQFNVTAAWDKASYATGDTPRATISGSAVATTTTTSQVMLGPITIPIVDANQQPGTVQLAAVPAMLSQIVATPESVTIDPSRPIVDNGPNPLVWTVGADKLSIVASKAL